MKIQICGAGAAAHALCWKLAESRRLEYLACSPGNAGTQALCDDPQCPDADAVLYAPAFSDDPEGGEDEAVLFCAVSDGKKAVLFPAVRNLRGGTYYLPDFSFSAPDALPDQIPAKRGFYTVECRNGQCVRILCGLAGPAACLTLALLKGDLTQLLIGMDEGFQDGYSAEYRDGTAMLLAVRGETGQRIEGLADLEGDVGVFLQDAERADGHLRTTGKCALYLCARGKTEEQCLQKLEKAAALVRLVREG